MLQPGLLASLRALVAITVVALAVGCGGGGDDVPADPDAGPPDAPLPDAAVDLTEALFRPDHILEVDITLAAADWAVLRNQPDQIGLPGVTCASQPTQVDYTYFPADVTIDGATTTNVGLRKKGGFGSLSSERPGLKVKPNEYVPGQRMFGLKNLTFNNNKQDPTYVSQCLGYGLFRAAGIPAPRCSFAHVTVNGEDLGIYSNVESIKEDFLARHFADPTGNLYESGGEFVPGGTGGFQPKTDAATPDCSDLDPVVAALQAPDAQLEARLGAVVNLDEFIRYWAMEVITDHWDGYANNQNNYFFYHDPTSDQLAFIPWGIDALFTGRARSTRPLSVFACGSLAWRLYSVPSTRARYLATVRDLLATVWNEPAILAELDRMQALLTPRLDPTGTGDFAAQLANVRRFVAGRAATLRAELDAGDPVWPYAAGEPSCRINIGSLSTTFTTTWATLDRFGVGAGSMTGTVAGVDVGSTGVTASAGLDGDGKATLRILAPLPDGRYAVVFVIIHDPTNYAVGTRTIDLATVAALMTFYDPATDTTAGGGLLLPGTLTLTSASTTPGGVVSGTVSGPVLEL
ncbi:MAG: CotH kinase family protein [Kofleriaceae bacterium]